MKAFISYSHKDEGWLEQLHNHLSTLRRESVLDDWYDHEILAGADLDGDISRELDACDLFIPLVSSDFLESNYCVEKELEHALSRHRNSEIDIVPVVVRPCDWKNSPLQHFKALPKDGKAISEWTNYDTAFLNVVQEIRKLCNARGAEPKAAKAGGMSTDQAAAPHKSSTYYRIKRDFDAIDRADFRERSFYEIKEYFRTATQELASVDGLRGRFSDLGPTSFSCTVLNQRRQRGVGHITVHSGAGDAALGDIGYSFSENAPANTANGWFSVDADEYDLFLKWNGMSHGGEDRRVSVRSGAEILWKEFVSQAGVEYA